MDNKLEQVDHEVIEVEDVVYDTDAIADFSEKDAAMYPFKEARYRISHLINKYPGYAEEGARALGYIDLAESIIKHLPHRTYGDYGHVA